MAFAFPDAGNLTCNRHLRGNCVNYLTDKIGVPHGPKMRLLSAIIGDNGLVHSTGSSVHPNYMDITEDGYLMCSTYANKVTKVQVDTDKVVFDKS
ncbi:hypothetical protein PoB_001176300, partial [Plakobranchus ocellatus]